MDNKQRRRIGFSLVYVLIAILAIWLFQSLIFGPVVLRRTEVTYDKFLEELRTCTETTSHFNNPSHGQAGRGLMT